MKRFILLFCGIVLSLACSQKNTPITVDPPIDTSKVEFAKGADISWVTEMEAAGVKFYDATGKAQECMALMKALGMNTIRLRVWVNPSPAWNNTADVVAKALRAKSLGMRIMIDFHYSDFWADPGKQNKPTAWAGKDLAGLKTALAEHTTEVLIALKNNSIDPEWVQVGNETNDGMLWPEGKASTNMNNFAQLLNAGYDAVKAVFPKAKVIAHISNGYNNTLFRWMFDGLKTNGARYDVIGMSLYPSPSDWSNLNQHCLSNMNDMVSRYGKEVMIVEVGMSWDSPQECRQFLSDLISKVKSVSGNKGLGVLYWEPQAYNWKGYSLGAFDNAGKPTVALDAFKN